MDNEKENKDMTFIVGKNAMDGDDKGDGTRHGIFRGEECNGWRQRRWMATTKKMDHDIAFFGGRMQWMVKKKMNGEKEDGTRHGIFLGE